MAPEDIELLFQSRSHSQTTATSGQDGDGDAISDEEKNIRVLKLKEVLLDAHHALASDSEDLDIIAEKLADGSRDVSWRVPIGDSGLLEFFLGILHVDELRQSLLIHTLRLIGNSCADTDENRARVVQSQQIPSITKLFSHDTLLPFLIPVVYNVCVDYEPAQLEACKAGLSRVLVGIVAGPRINSCRPFLNIICKILALLISQEPEVNLADPETPFSLLSLAVNRTHPTDLEDYCGLTSVALAYLTHEQFQIHFLTSGHCELLMQCFEDSFGRSDVADADPEEVAQLKQIWAAFVQIYADISASPFFATLPLGSPLVQRLVRWLGSSHAQLQTAACLSLGNVARSDEASTTLLPGVFTPISTILTSSAPPGPQLLHAVLSFLKNLAIPALNKPLLGQLLLEPPSGSILARLWSTESQPQTQFTAVSLTRLLVSGCPANVARLCAPLSPDPSSPAHERTNLHLLIGITSHADAEPTKFEGARTVAAVCKVLHSGSSGALPTLSWTSAPSTGSADSSSRERFYTAHQTEVSRCLADLITQRRFPALRSESLFTMALMSRSPDGAKIAGRAVHPVEGCRVLVEAVTGRDMFDGRDLASPLEGSESVGVVRQNGSRALDAIEGLGLEPQQASLDPTQAASMARIDRENGMVLVAELLKQDASVFPQFRRSLFEEILKTGGELVLSQRHNGGDAVNEADVPR